MTNAEKDKKYRRVQMHNKSHMNQIGWLHGFTLTSDSIRSLGPDLHIPVPPHGVAIIETEKGMCILVELNEFMFIN